MTAFEGDDGREGPRTYQEAGAQGEEIFTTLLSEMESLPAEVSAMLQQGDVQARSSLSTRMADVLKEAETAEALFAEARDGARAALDTTGIEVYEHRMLDIDELYLDLSTIWEDAMRQAVERGIMPPLDAVRAARVTLTKAQRLVPILTRRIGVLMDRYPQIPGEDPGEFVRDIPEEEEVILQDMFDAISDDGESALRTLRRSIGAGSADSAVELERASILRDLEHVMRSIDEIQVAAIEEGILGQESDEDDDDN